MAWASQIDDLKVVAFCREWLGKWKMGKGYDLQVFSAVSNAGWNSEAATDNWKMMKERRGLRHRYTMSNNRIWKVERLLIDV
jgi:hypothetical protein